MSDLPPINELILAAEAVVPALQARSEDLRCTNRLSHAAELTDRRVARLQAAIKAAKELQ